MKSVLDYLRHSAAVYPDKTAFADTETGCTFKELETRGEIGGSALIPYHIYGRPVPVMMEKSVLTIQVMMSIVYAGGFYVIVDATQPVTRLQQILDTLDADLMIAAKENDGILAELSFKGKILHPEELFAGEADPAALAGIENRRVDILPLYGIFTSGSTGVPKGVVVSHRNVIDFIDPFSEIFGFTSEDIIGNQAPWDFDVSVKDIYTGLKCGAQVQLIPKQYFSFPMMLLDYLEDCKVTSLTWAVSALCIVSVLGGLDYKVPAAIRRVMFSGETMPIRHLNEWRSKYPKAMFVNLYGPTEITCNCTYYILDREFSAGDILPIGVPFPNEEVFLLGEDGTPVTEKGTEGEICVSGTAVSLGYYRNPEQTAKAFVQNPLNSAYPEIIYRTGDLGYFNERGELCFASRKDFQIKHMGHRIELGEIEAALEKVEEVLRSCCFFDTNKNKIVCYYQGDIDKRNLSLALGRFVPDFMIPNVFRQIDQMPLNKNGKIDRNKLKELYSAGRRKR